jgi:hypothetical protein
VIPSECYFKFLNSHVYIYVGIKFYPCTFYYVFNNAEKVASRNEDCKSQITNSKSQKNPNIKIPSLVLIGILDLFGRGRILV